MCRPHWSIHDTSKRKTPLKSWCLTFINPATGWFKMAKIPNKTAVEIVDITEKTWFTRYPLPHILAEKNAFVLFCRITSDSHIFVKFTCKLFMTMY